MKTMIFTIKKSILIYTKYSHLNKQRSYSVFPSHVSSPSYESGPHKQRKGFSGRRNGDSSRKAIQMKDFQSLLCMQKTRTFCKKLPEERKGSKASWASPDSCRRHSLFWCRITLFVRWLIFSSSPSSHGILYNRRRLRFRISGLRSWNSSHLYFPAYLGLFGSPIPIA